MSDLSGVTWRKSSRSAQTGQCVEVASGLVDIAAVRDSKNPGQSALVFTRDQLTAFLTTVKAGSYDL